MTGFDRVELAGGPYRRGRQHGEACAAAIEATVATYRERFEHEGLDEDALADRARDYLELIKSSAWRYAGELRGIATGADVDLLDIVLLNARWEMFYPAIGDSSHSGVTEGCTSFGLLPSATADSHSHLGQNWDWLAPIRDRLVLLDVTQPEAVNFVGITEPGIAGPKMGVNEHGIGIVINGLVSAQDGTEAAGLPYHVRFRHVLDTGSQPSTFGHLRRRTKLRCKRHHWSAGQRSYPIGGDLSPYLPTIPGTRRRTRTCKPLRSGNGGRTSGADGDEYLLSAGLIAPKVATIRR